MSGKRRAAGRPTHCYTAAVQFVSFKISDGQTGDSWWEAGGAAAASRAQHRASRRRGPGHGRPETRHTETETETETEAHRRDGDEWRSRDATLRRHSAMGGRRAARLARPPGGCSFNSPAAPRPGARERAACARRGQDERDASGRRTDEQRWRTTRATGTETDRQTERELQIITLLVALLVSGPPAEWASGRPVGWHKVARAHAAGRGRRSAGMP